MQVNNNQTIAVKAEFSLGVGKKSLDVSADLVNDLVNKSLEGSKQIADSARANQGIGTNLNVVV